MLEMVVGRGAKFLHEVNRNRHVVYFFVVFIMDSGEH